jgi:ribosomal protein S18 acetylase RimI-like enzyme
MVESGKITSLVFNTFFMATIASALNSTTSKKVRPFDPRRDLLAVADLIETCFAATLDPDGQRYIQQMRSAAQSGALNRWISMASSHASLPLGGFVWVEAGQVVGNLSLVPFFHQGQRIYLIANVAVAPDYRRQGIAQVLTEAAIEKCRQRRVNRVWLQVRDNNPAAFGLYTKMGFSPRTRRTTWIGNPKNLKGEMPPGARVTLRPARFWDQQRNWLAYNYPVEHRWNFPLKLLPFQPGILGLLHRFFNELDVRHWAVQKNGELLGVMTWQGTRGYADRLWLAATPPNDDDVLHAVLPHIRQERRVYRPLSLNYPEGRATETLRSVGLRAQHTLIWMNTHIKT